MTALQLKAALQSPQPPLLLDIRTPGEVEDFSVAESLHVPMDELLLQIDKIVPYRSQHVVVVCGTGILSNIAVRILQKKGFEHVEHLEGGLEAWLAL